MPRNNIAVPLFLQPTKARELNNLIYKNTGCFLFLTIPEEELLGPIPQGGGCNSYIYEVLNLYKMYNDYGHYFLWVLIQKSQLPRIDACSDSSLENKINELDQHQQRVLDHYLFVTRTARHVLAHGIFQATTKLPPYKDPKILELENQYSRLLSGKCWPDTDNDWKIISKWVADEADCLYRWLQDWSNVWKYCSTDLDELKKKFYYGRWKYAINQDAYVIKNEESEYVIGDYNGRKYYLFEEKNTELTSFAMVFSSQMLFDALSHLVSACPSGARSEYELGGVCWKLASPEVNWQYLYKNINYSGIKKVRDKLLHPLNDSATCPDGFRLYMQGLSDKLTGLPTVLTSTSKKSSRFVRK